MVRVVPVRLERPPGRGHTRYDCTVGGAVQGLRQLRTGDDTGEPAAWSASQGASAVHGDTVTRSVCSPPAAAWPPRRRLLPPFRRMVEVTR
jgi:hypothetical protein